MPRQLPWAVKKRPIEKARQTASPASTSAHPPAPTSRQSARDSATPRAVQGAHPSGEATSRSLGTRPNRSPSTSPPPQPVEEEFMIDGVDHDDKFRMVEDEFVSLAGDFTKHLHAAEYQRLKALAKSQNADAIRTISRPVTGRMTDLVRRRQKALGLAVSQRQGIKNALARRGTRANSDDEEPWAGTFLQGLMDSPRKAMRLPTMISATAGTRAAAGDRAGPSPSKEPQQLARSSELDLALGNQASSNQLATAKEDSNTESEDDDEDDGDLDAPSIPLETFKTRKVGRSNEATASQMATRPTPRPPAFAKAASKPSPVPSRPHPEQRLFRTPTSDSSRLMGPTPTPSRSGSDKKPVDLTKDDNDDEDDFFARRRSHRDQKRKRTEHTARPSGLDDIPFI